MKVAVAIDSFKGSLSSMEAGLAAKEGILRVYPKAEVFVRPLADGGEGTMDALILGMGGRLCKVQVTGPLGAPVLCPYGIDDHTGTAIIDMSGAAGINLIAEKDRNPFYTTTFGVGEVIKDAILNGCRKFIVGIGGSVTNDGGAGMLQALGYGFLDEQGNPVGFGAKELSHIVRITDTDVLPQLKECEFKIACDVTNVLCGEFGSSYVYGPQKGATPDMVIEMDGWLAHYAEQVQKFNPKADPLIPGTGAAGGLGFAFLAFLNSTLESGIDIIMDAVKLETCIETSDLVITGEGRLDEQTVMGKAPAGVAKLAKKYGKPVLAFSGMVTEEARQCNEHGIDAFFPILRRVVSLEQAMDAENSKKNMSDTVEQVFRLLLINKKES